MPRITPTLHTPIEGLAEAANFGPNSIGHIFSNGPLNDFDAVAISAKAIGAQTLGAMKSEGAKSMPMSKSLAGSLATPAVIG